MNVHVSRDGKVIGELSEDDFRKNVRRAYLGDGAAVAGAAGAFCVVEVLLPIFFDRLRTLAPFLRWVFGITIILSVMVCSYGVGRGSGPVPVMTPALPSPRPLPAVAPVVPVPVICPFASPQVKDPAQTPTKMICESLDKFIVVYRAGRGSAMPAKLSATPERDSVPTKS